MYVICAVVKDEKPEYLTEWVDWHLNIGFDHIHLADNESNPHVQKMRGVTIYKRPGHPVQVPWYNEFIDRYSSGVSWAAFIDLDEFIVPYGDLNIKKFLSGFRNGAVTLNWKLYGPTETPNSDGTQIGRFRHRLEFSDKFSEHVKTICRPSLVEKFTEQVHYPIFKNGLVAVDPDGTPVGCPFNPSHSYRAWISHYYTRSREDWDRKLRRGRCDKVGDKLGEAWFDDIKEAARVYDDTSVLLKARLKGQQ